MTNYSASPQTNPPRDGRANVVIRLLLLICLILLTIIAGGILTMLWRGQQSSGFQKIVPPSQRPAANLPAQTTPSQPTPPQSKAVVPGASNQVQIYFTADGLKLKPQIIELPRPMSPYERLHFVLDELLRGPMSNGLKSTLPEGTELRAAFIRDDTATINLSGAILAKPLGGVMAETLCVNAIAQTVIRNIDTVKNVRILVDDQTPAVLWDQLDLTGPITPDDSLIEK